jgi:uncharacterized membrane protein (UPF0182 family)
MIEKPPHVEPSKPVADGKLNGSGSHHIIRQTSPRVGGLRRVGRPIRLVLIGVILVIAILAFLPSWIQKWLWMRQLGYSGIFWTLFSRRWGLFGAAFVIALLYLWVNLRLAAKNSPTFSSGGLTSESALNSNFSLPISPTILKLAMGAVAAVGSLFYALIFYGQWDTYLRFRFGGSFRLSDPLFGANVGFYVFRLPFYELLQSSLSALALITLLAVLACYAYFGLPQFSRGRQPMESWSAKTAPHLSILRCVLIASWGWGFYLDHFELLYSTQGVVYGAGYTADHVTRIAFWIMIGAAAALFATGSDERMETAAEIMNRHGAIDIEQTSGSEPQLPGVVRRSMPPIRRSPVMGSASRAKEPPFSCDNQT